MATLPKSTLTCILLLSALAGCDDTAPGTAGGPAWTRLSVPDAPSARHDASMVAAPEAGLIYLFGGRDDRTCRSDLWRFSLGSQRWERVADESGPSARSGAGLAWDRAGRRLILYGGYCHDGLGQTHFFGDLWFYTPGDGWRREYVSGGPGQRAWHAMRVRGSRLIFYGGSAPAPGYHRNDVWELDLERLTWRRPASDGGPLMPARPVMMASPDRAGQLFVFGRHGIPAATSVGLWELDLNEDRWRFSGARSGDRVVPPLDYHLAAASDDGWLVSAVGPGDARSGWNLFWTQLGTEPRWFQADGLEGPATPFGIACASEPGRAASWLCFGGVWRDRLSDQTWSLGLGSAVERRGPRP